MKEINEYRCFCTKREIEKAVNTLSGLLTGISIDHEINNAEIAELLHWCNLQREYIDHQPFTELVPLVEKAIEDSIISQEEYQDIQWLCDNYSDESVVSDTITRSIQIMEGVLHGILADGELKDAEILELNDWIQTFQFLEGTYPYDEIRSLLFEILSDGIITADERSMFQAYISAFIDATVSLNILEADCRDLQQHYHIDGVCAIDPHIEIENNLFCFTGASARGTRDDIAAIILERGGLFNNNVTQKTKYLIVGDKGNPCWMFSCYGRKVEKAVELRKSGNSIAIIRESDFWNALGEDFS